MIHDEVFVFVQKLNIEELAAWNSFKSVIHGFVGNNRDENYSTFIQELLKNYKTLGCRMSLKVHFLD
jgi:hypothetical protein